MKLHAKAPKQIANLPKIAHSEKFWEVGEGDQKSTRLYSSHITRSRMPASAWKKFFFNDTATTEIYTGEDTLSLHDALPI